MFVASVNPACNAHAPYSNVICGLSCSVTYFSHYILKGIISGK